MVGNLVGGLAQGFAQGYDLGNKMYETSQQRKLQKGLGDLYDPEETEMDRQLANRPNVKGDVSNTDQMMNRIQQERQLYAEYGTPQQLANFNRRALNQQTQGLRLQQLQSEVAQQEEVNSWIDNNADMFESDPLAASLELARLTGDANALATLGSERADMVASNAAYEFMNADDAGLATSYESIRDGRGVTINRGDNGVNQFVIHAEGDPSNVIETIEYGSPAELRSQLTPRLSEASPMIGNKVYQLQAELAEQRREAMGEGGFNLGTIAPEDFIAQVDNRTNQLLRAEGLDPQEANPDTVQRLREQARGEVNARYRAIANGFSPGVYGGGSGQTGGNMSLTDPAVIDLVQQLATEAAGSGGGQGNPSPGSGSSQETNGENLPPRMRRGLE